MQSMLKVLKEIKSNGKKSEQKKSLRNVAAGVVVGAVVGTAAGVLWAPNQGKNFRDKLGVASKVLIEKALGNSQKEDGDAGKKLGRKVATEGGNGATHEIEIECPNCAEPLSMHPDKFVHEYVTCGHCGMKHEIESLQGRNW